MKITPVVIAAALLTLAAVPGSAGPFSAIYALWRQPTFCISTATTSPPGR